MLLTTPSQTCLVAHIAWPCPLQLHCCFRSIRRPVTCRHASPQERTYGNITSDTSNGDRPPPWSFGFQCNERYLEWDTSAQHQLLKMHVAEKLNKEVWWVESKLLELADILPGFSSRLDNMKADLVVQLISDIQAVAQKLVDLRAELPNVDVSSLLAKHPILLLQLDKEKVTRQVEVLRESFPGMDIPSLVEREPLMLTVAISSVFAEVKRLMPSANPAQYVYRNPTVVLSMDEHMMGSAIDGNLT